MAEAVGVTLPVEDGLPAAEYVELAQLAERSGYDAVLAGEVAGPAHTAWMPLPCRSSSMGAATMSLASGTGGTGVTEALPASA